MFDSGEKMKVRQKSSGVKPGDNVLLVDVEFDGDLPKVLDVSASSTPTIFKAQKFKEHVRIDTTTLELVSKTSEKLIGKGRSSIQFGDQGHIPFTFEDQIDYSNTNPNNTLVQSGSTLRIKTETTNSKDDNMKLEIRNERLGTCPLGYENKLKGCAGQ